MKIQMGYPSEEDDRLILARFREADPLNELKPVVTAEDLLKMQKICREVHIAADVEDYIIRLVHATRTDSALQLGASPRAMLALYNASQAFAAIRGRSFVTPDDIKYLMTPVLIHRIIPKSESRLRGQKADQTLKDIKDSVFVPVEEEGAAKEG